MLKRLELHENESKKVLTSRHAEDTWTVVTEGHDGMGREILRELLPAELGIGTRDENDVAGGDGDSGGSGGARHKRSRRTPSRRPSF